MKLINQISSIIIALLFICTINLPSIITLNFYVNQSELIELFCINKAQVELSCNGKCHLTKELVKIDTKEELPFSRNEVEKETELTFDNNIDCLDFTTKENTLITFYDGINTSITELYLSVSSPPPEA